MSIDYKVFMVFISIVMLAAVSYCLIQDIRAAQSPATPETTAALEEGVMANEVMKHKAELFDILRSLDRVKQQYQALDQIRIQKLKLLHDIENKRRQLNELEKQEEMLPQSSGQDQGEE